MKSYWLWMFWFVSLPVMGRAMLGTEINVSTPIRVLLDEAGRSSSLESPAQTLFVKVKHPGPWLPLGKLAKLLWSEKTKEITLQGEQAKIAAPILFVRGGPNATDTIRYGTKTYRGLLKLVATEAGWMAINILPMEEYLAGTLAAEMNPTWDLEALKAQAVASRTYALDRARHPKNAHYDLMGTTDDQVYSGAAVETSRIRKVLESTEGEYLSKQGEPAKLFFHSRCGGLTEPEGRVWKNSKSQHVTVACPYCRSHPFPWSFSIEYASLLSALKLPKSLLAPKLTALERSPTGRVTSFKLEAGPNSRMLDGNTLRSLLGYQRLKSARFQWSADRGQIHFMGQGAGHGVGMCQWGAGHMAKEGKTYRQILAYYYPQLSFQSPRPLALPLEAKNQWR